MLKKTKINGCMVIRSVIKMIYEHFFLKLKVRTYVRDDTYNFLYHVCRRAYNTRIFREDLANDNISQFQIGNPTRKPFLIYT